MKQNSVAIVTGASQGIGRATAIRLAVDFSALVLVARDGDAMKDVAEAVREAGSEPLSIALDLSRVKSPETWSKLRSLVTDVSTRFSTSRSGAADRPVRDDR